MWSDNGCPPFSYNSNLSHAQAKQRDLGHMSQNTIMHYLRRAIVERAQIPPLQPHSSCEKPPTFLSQH